MAARPIVCIMNGATMAILTMTLPGSADTPDITAKNMIDSVVDR